LKRNRTKKKQPYKKIRNSPKILSELEINQCIMRNALGYQSMELKVKLKKFLQQMAEENNMILTEEFEFIPKKTNKFIR